MFELNRSTHVLSFICYGMKLSWEISRRINELRVKYFDHTGYVEFDTNIGMESIDILDDHTETTVRSKVSDFLKSAQILEVRYVE